MKTFFSRALVPVRRNPLKVKVDDGPQDVGHPSAILLFGFYQPLRIFEQDRDAEGRAICPSAQKKRKRASKKLKISRTRGGGADASFGIKKFVKLDIEHGLPDATCEHVPGEADHLLGPGEGVDDVVELRAQTLVSEHGELVEPRVVDEAGIAQPVDRELGVIRIRDDGSNHANLNGSRN
jgi:hypothetical protein